MSNINFSLLAWQRKVLSDNHRFKIICAGRRTGKSRLSAVMLLIYGLKCPSGSDVMYVAPTQGMARTIIWKLIHELGRDVIKSSHSNNMDVTLINDCVIRVRGADNPDTLRGGSLFFVVLDEMAFIKKGIWEEIIRPSLADRKGDALIISSPEYRNHFYDIYMQGVSDDEKFSDYKSWHLTTYDNETIDREEIEQAKATMSPFAFKKEFMASFDTIGAGLFKEEWIKYGKEPSGGSWFMACDLAGFKDVSNTTSASSKKLDESAFAIVKVSDDGKWFVKKIEHGRWDVRETAVRILKNIRDFRPTAIGIERGTTFNAVMPYLSDLMRKNNIYAHIQPLSHDNQKKTERVVWALQGMFEHGRIILNEDEKWYEFIDQLLMFPTKGVHDDQIESLAYISQLAVTTYFEQDDDDEYEPLDMITAY